MTTGYSWRRISQYSTYSNCQPSACSGAVLGITMQCLQVPVTCVCRDAGRPTAFVRVSLLLFRGCVCFLSSYSAVKNCDSLASASVCVNSRIR